MAPDSSTPGIWHFQLRILSGMRGNEVIVHEALRKLGATHSDMLRSRERTERIFLPAGRFENAISVLGPPRTSETVHGTTSGEGGSVASAKLTYDLPLWPGLVFYLVGTPGVPVAHDFGFARSPHAPPVSLNRIEDLRPWACVRDEVIEFFGRPVQVGDVWPPYEEYLFQARSADGRVHRFWAVFSWNLLQRVERA